MRLCIFKIREVSFPALDQDQGAGDCVTLDPSTGQWRSSNTLLHSRGHHASWRVEAGVILLGGAAQGEDTERRTSEIVRPDGSGEEMFAMKFPTGFVFSGHHHLLNIYI